jgi:rubredoxin
MAKQAAEVTGRQWAKAVAVALEIACPDPDCGREDSIPTTGGSFMWDHLPDAVTCPDCGQTFRVSGKVAL